ncbi:uncharacterized protein LOC131663312 [Phymastichus coffea]|uniref:uncharacterized protein LOC131663312 n=1 Tax=Phymastichus coffea TaxID=108790 RepID=UPI00273C82E4|nr:uncharacterized protein LOC131663312 [Phymastichus coffea]
MEVLPLPFHILTVCGFWSPQSLNTVFKKCLYNIFSFIMYFLISSFTLSHLVEIIMSANNFEELTGNCFMVLSMLNVCCKMTNILYFRSDILQLLKNLSSSRCRAQNIEEQNLLQKFHEKARFVTLCYASLTETTCILITARTFFVSVNRILPFKAWIPYKITSSSIYWITFFHQTIAHVGAANLQIANETLICWLMIQACSQLELLKYRLKKITKSNTIFDNNNFLRSRNSISTYSYSSLYSKNTLVECVKHHRCIMKFLKHRTQFLIFFNKHLYNSK